MQAPRPLVSPSDEAPNCWIPYSIKVQVAGEAESGRQHLYLCNHIRQIFISHSHFLCLEPLNFQIRSETQAAWMRLPWIDCRLRDGRGCTSSGANAA